MTTPAGWEPLPSEERSSAAREPRASARRVVIRPFTRLARTHAAVAGGDTAVALALAGSLFFDISPQAARGKVALYLLLTMAPFAVVAPVLGPAIDRMRGGRRLIVLMSCAGRAAVSALLVLHIDSLLLFPEAFLFLVFQKSYAVSKSALVPTVVANDAELVEANSKLGLLAGITGFVVAVPALILKLADVRVTLCLAVTLYVLGLLLATRLPRDVVARKPADEAERQELRSSGVVLAASTMAVVRATVGFLTFQIAFLLRSEKSSVIWFGLLLLFSAVGTLAGNAIGPSIRRRLPEELMLAVALALIAFGGVLAAFGGGDLSAALLGGAVGTAAAFARLAFDSIVQRDAPDANRGRAFAEFETRFQMAWVVAAFIPVIVPIPRDVGFLIVAALAGFALVTYVIGWRALRSGKPLPPRLSDRVVAEVRRRRNNTQRRGQPRPSAPREGLPPPEAGSRP